ncbi:low molecular weight phosphatase family protein [Agrococcus sp. Marseille-Q4369]|uniref:arsenate reductase/protein-tyrosine-phosphatase family protein n=1 Tax=Agrococcus sp. Marseille-Q4369 TaxID=2810513 RepID=UPI001B8D68D7|nr:low molecular weight phosphatase family protein [Agrococcus sp. Marseille-Q4369]QUW19805.1 low molecular weight phosphatase family protein [Agrococcus sp. Marseille-Q4369]
MPLPRLRSHPTATAVRDDATIRVLTVCTGNLCRSPLAEQLLRARLPRAFGVDELPELLVSSAGTRAFDDDPMDPLAARESLRLGAAGGGDHRARRLLERHVADADLILAMAREHRSAAASLAPVAQSRAFTLVELARIVDALAGGAVDAPVAPRDEQGVAAWLRQVVRAAATVRGLMPLPASPLELDIEDPYRFEAEVYRRSAESVAESVDRLVGGLRRLADGR